MKRLFTLTIAALGLMLLTVAASDRSVLAGDEPKGSVAGTILDKSGQPAIGVTITLYQDKPQLASPPEKVGNSTFTPGGWIMLQSKMGVGRGMGSAKTDDKGAYIIKNVKVGDYKWMVKQNAKYGGANGDVHVDANKETKLDVKLGEIKRGG